MPPGNAVGGAQACRVFLQAWPLLAQKKRDEQEFAVKADTLSKLQQAARDGACQLFYFDQSGFSASPPVQRGWSPIGEPHRVFPQPHCKRSVLGALDFGANLLIHHASKTTIKRPDVVQFLDQIARESTPGLTTVVVLDNASIHHNINQESIDRWFLKHRMVLFYLPPYSPELNLIEIIWKHAKYHWRRFVSWTKETIDVDGIVNRFVKQLLARTQTALARTKRLCNKHVIQQWNLTQDLAWAYEVLDFVDVDRTMRS